MRYQEIQHLETRPLGERGRQLLALIAQCSLNGDGSGMLSLAYKSGFKRS